MKPSSVEPEETVTNEIAQMLLEERKAILAAIRCPGKTHSLIKNPELRRAYALELNGLRNQSVLGKWRKDLSTNEYWRGVRLGMESAFWSLQKLESRTFAYEGRRVTWQLSEPEDHRSPEERQRYEEFIEKIKIAHAKALELKQEILSDHQAGKITDYQKVRYLQDVDDREKAKVENLQIEYRQ